MNTNDEIQSTPDPTWHADSPPGDHVINLGSDIPSILFFIPYCMVFPTVFWGI